MSGRLCALQMHHTDLVPGIESRNAVVPLQDSGLFDHVVLAVADMPENDVLEPFAERLGIPIFRGPTEDVAKRLADCATAYGCDVVARALPGGSSSTSTWSLVC